MTVLAIDPRREADVALIRAVARSCQSLILVVVPGPHSQGVTGALEAGADVCVRESDSVEVLGAQIGSLTGGAQHAPQVLLAPAGTPKRAPQGAFAPKDEGHCPAVSRPAVVSVQVSAQCTDGLTPELNLVGLGAILLGRE